MPLGTEVGLGSGHIVLGPASGPARPPRSRKGQSSSPSFRPIMSIVAKWSPISATAEHLLPFYSVLFAFVLSSLVFFSTKLSDWLEGTSP